MNRKIELLDNLTINKIAAGEVIEAPYSVVKELVENSIDASASTITLEIKEGGKKYIRVTDDGLGIKEEYIEKAFMRHSTSKITNINDLNSINSLGFRGEALASIAAISQVKIITRTKEQQYGISMEVIGGEIGTVKRVGCPIGTTIIVKNLFFNTPARFKFMKSNSAETMKISEIIARLSLSNPDISFQYINNNNIMFTTPGNKKLSDAILSTFDKNTFKNLIYLEKEKQHMKLQGYIGQPSFVRGNRNLQIIYINGRYIKNKVISKAIEKAYKEKVTINKFPICILNLYLDPSEIDINVHPAKIEVKFENEDQVYEFIYQSVSSALEEGVIIPKLAVGSKNNNTLNRHFIPTTKVDNNDNKNMLVSEIKEDYIKESIENRQFIDIKNDNKKEHIEINNTTEDIIQSTFLNTLLNQYKIIGQLFNTYIILEQDQSIYLIDQHAAHERLLYNEFLKEIKNEKVICQRLIKPEVLELSNEDYILLTNYIDLFIKLGFHVEDFGINTIIVREVPMILGKPQNFSFIYEALDEIKNNNNINNQFQDIIIKKACKEAIKAKDKLDYYETKKLVEKLSDLTPPLTCPHGRPIILTISQYEIEKYFKRIQ